MARWLLRRLGNPGAGHGPPAQRQNLHAVELTGGDGERVR